MSTPIKPAARPKAASRNFAFEFMLTENTRKPAHSQAATASRLVV
jgi:hypothetical protein